MADAKLERIYTIPLSKAYDYIRTRRTERAVKLLREFVARHMKVELEDVRISEGVNALLWRDSIQRPPRRVKVRVVKEGEMAKAWLPGEEEDMKKAEDARKKAEEEKKKEADKKAAKEKPAATAAPASGAAGAATPAAAKPAAAPATEAPAQKSQNPKAGDMHMKKSDVKKESVQPKSV